MINKPTDIKRTLVFLRKNSSTNSENIEEAISGFLADFNTQNGTNVSFGQLLDIYNGAYQLKPKDNIALCKAFLDFIQKNGLEIKLDGISFVLKYKVVSDVDFILEAPSESRVISGKDLAKFSELNQELKNFIQMIRDRFSILIDHESDLGNVNIDDLFGDIFPKFKEKQAAALQEEELQKNAPSSSIKINDGFVLSLDTTDDQLIKRLSYCSNKELTDLFQCIYDNLSVKNKGSMYHIVIARFLFGKSYVANLGQTIKKLITNGKRLGSATISKFDFQAIRDLLISGNKSGGEEKVDPANVVEELIDGEKLRMTSGSLIDLSDDKSLIDCLIKLPANDIQSIFAYLEQMVQIKYAVPERNITSKLVGLLQLTEENGANLAQKITSLRRKPATVTEKFLRNNIDVTAFRQLLLNNFQGTVKEDTAGKEEGGVNDAGEEEISNLGEYLDFSFLAGDEQVTLRIDLEKIKSMEGFIHSLNDLAAKECERWDLSGYLRNLTSEDFSGIKFDTEFFDNFRIHKRSTEIFDILDQEVLESFLAEWCKQLGVKLKNPKKPYITPGSEDELWDFVFNVWQKRIDKIIHSEVRKSRRNTGSFESRKKSATLTKEMFEGVDSLSADLFSRLNPKNFIQIFSRLKRSEVEALIKEYLDSRSK